MVIEATTHGVLCSQEAEEPQSAETSPSRSPDLKKARISENLRTEASPVPAAAARLQDRTTLLSRCDRTGVRYSVLVAVVHPCHLKEVKVSGESELHLQRLTRKLATACCPISSWY